MWLPGGEHRRALSLSRCAAARTPVGHTSAEPGVAGDVLMGGAELDLRFRVTGEPPVGPSDLDVAVGLPLLPGSPVLGMDRPLDLWLARLQSGPDVEAEEAP